MFLQENQVLSFVSAHPKAGRLAIKNGLALLGMEAPERM